MAEFTHEMFGKLRTVEIDGGVWFSLLDVSNSLEYSRVSDAKKNLSDSQYKTADSRVRADLGLLGACHSQFNTHSASIASDLGLSSTP